MGIPGLLSSIGAYAQEERWSQSGDRKKSIGLVIDGPAFAYYVYYRCHTQMRASGHALSAVPDYQFLLQTALLWLECVEKFGLVIKHIFFDGALPMYKHQVRHERLQKSIDQMRAYKLLNPDLPSAYKHRAHAEQQQTPTNALLDHGSHVPSDLKSVPAATFLVPSVLECLLSTKYRNLVQVVPCEADLMCTSSDACTESDIILTSDSDLVLQNPSGRIVFFNSLRFTNPAPDGFFLALDAQSYLAKQIASCLQLDQDLLVLMGFHMSLDYQAGLVECSKRAKQGLLANNDDYHVFRAQYHPWAICPDWKDVFSPQKYCTPVGDYVTSDASTVARTMDPRVLEFIVATKIDTRNASTCHMFLPPLLDDPARSSAWSSSASVRHMAYSLWMQRAATTDDDQFRVCEIDRRGIRLTQNALEVERFDSPGSDSSLQIRRLVQEMTRLLDLFKGVGEHQAWTRTILLLFLWSDSQNLGPDKIPARRDIATLINRRSLVDQKSTTWAMIHVIAQIDAWYYSLRIFKQVVNLVKPLKLLNGSLEQLRAVMQTIPAIGDILTSPTRGLDFGPMDDDLNRELDKFYTDFDKERDCSTSTSKSQKSKKKRKASQEQTKPEADVKAPRNMYDLLSDET